MSSSKQKSGLRKEWKLRDYQEFYVKKILSDIEKTNKINYLISSPQGVGKTLIALKIFSELLNKGKVKNVLAIAPSTNLRKHWIDEANKFFYGLKFREVNPGDSLGKIRTELKHRKDIHGLSMTMHRFKKFKKHFRQDEFDLVIIDEATDTVLAKDFADGRRMSHYFEGIEKWKGLKLLTFPKDVDEKTLETMIKKFNEKLSELIVKVPESFKEIEYRIDDPITINDPLANEFIEILDTFYRDIRRNVLNILRKHGVKGHYENLETLLKYKTMERIKKNYGLDNETVNAIQTLIAKYILIKHLKKWTMYCGRNVLNRTILADQRKMSNWLEEKDMKLERLGKVVKKLVKGGEKVYIYSDYVSTANMLYKYISNLNIQNIEVVTGRLDANEQYRRLKNFRENGSTLISTPVFKGGTNIPEANSAIIFTPSKNIEAMHQIKGRIRGGKIITLAYKGYEEELMKQTIELLRD